MQIQKQTRIQTAAAAHHRAGSRENAAVIIRGEQAAGRALHSSARAAAGRSADKMTGAGEMRDLTKKVRKIIRIIERLPVTLMVIRTAAESIRIARRNLKAD